MDKKNSSLASANIVLTAVSLGVYVALYIFVAIITMQLVGFGNGMYSAFVTGWDIGSSDLYIAESVGGAMMLFRNIGMLIAVFFFLIGAAVKILALIFAIKGKKQNSRGYILTSAILSTACAITLDLISIAAAICAYILHDNMGIKTVEKEMEDEENKAIYGMK